MTNWAPRGGKNGRVGRSNLPAAELLVRESIGRMHVYGVDCLVEDMVGYLLDGGRIRTHKSTHDPAKVHGAFATPGDRPRKAKAG